MLSLAIVTCADILARHRHACFGRSFHLPRRRRHARWFVLIPSRFTLADAFTPNTDGIKIESSANNVLLTSGVNGVVSPKYFQKVVRKVKGGELQDVDVSSGSAA